MVNSSLYFSRGNKCHVQDSRNPSLTIFFFIYLFVLHFPPCKCKTGQRAKILLYCPPLRLCSHYTGLLLRMHENHTGYGFCSQKNSDFGAISVTKRSCAASIFKVESHISDSCSYHTQQLFASLRKTIQYSVNIATDIVSLFLLFFSYFFFCGNQDNMPFLSKDVIASLL